MAENTTVETVIFEVDVSDYQNKLVGLTQNIDALKTQQKLLREETEKGGKGYLKAAEELEKVNAELKVSQDEYRNTQRTLVGFIGAQKNQVDTTNFANNSIKANRELLKQLQSQYINTKNPTQEFTKTILTLTNELKKQESAIGDTRRNVGNYAEGFKSVVTQLGSSGGAFGSAIQGASGLNAAFAANPVLGLVTAFQQLFGILSQNKEVMDALEQATAFVSAAFSVVVDRVVQFGKGLFEVLSNPKQLIADFGQLIQDNLTNRFKAFGLIIDAIAEGDLGKLRDAFFQLGTGVTDISGKVKAAGQAFDQFGNDILKVANANAQAAKAQQDLDDAIRSSNEQQAEQEVIIYKLIKASKDKTKSDEERIKLAKQALALEEARANEERKIADQQVRILEQQFKGLKLTDEQEDRLSQARVKRSNALRQTLVLQEKIQNDLNALEQTLADEKAARLAKEKAAQDKIDADKAKAAQDEINRLNKIADRNAFLEELRIKTLLSGLEQETALFELAFEKRIEDLRALGLSEIRIEEIKQKEILEIKKKYSKEANKVTKDEAKTSEEIQREQIQAIQGITAGALNTIGSISDILSEVTARKQEELDAALESGALSEAEYAKQSTELKRKQFEENKAIQLATAVMQGINATLAAYTSGASIPLVGTVTGPLFAALAAAFSAVQIGMIASKQPPKFADGGEVFDVGGKPHSQGGTKYRGEDGNVIEVERGEKMFVMKATAAKQIHKLSQFNQMFGGRSWNGAPVNYAAQGGVVSDGGFSTSMVTEQIKSDIQTKNAIREAFINAPQPIVSVREITNVTKAVNKSVAVSEL